MSTTLVSQSGANAHVQFGGRRGTLSTQAPDLGPQVEVHEDRQGWRIFDAPATDVVAFDALRAHHGWRGPAKYVLGRDGVRHCIEFAIPPQNAGDQGMSDEDDRLARETLLAAAYQAAGRMLAAPTDVCLENHIKSETLCEWVQAEGHTVARDEQGNLCLAITHAGFDGQMRVVCGPEQLRMTMALGAWRGLPRLVEAAMLHLASEANARTRLVRIVWVEDGPARRCEGQVDLTGVPWVDESHSQFEPTARNMLQLGLAGLTLTARRLGRELAVLADPANRDLAEAINERIAARPCC